MNTAQTQSFQANIVPKRQRITFGSLVRHALLLFFVFLAIAPGLFMVNTALKSKEEYVFDKVGFPDQIVLTNFSDALVESPFLLWMGNSVIVSVGSVVLSTTISALGAFAIARMEFWGRNLLLALTTSLIVIPPIVMIVPLFVLYTQLDLISTYTGAILIYTGLITPFSVYLLVSFFRTLPTELFEAALIDGATPFGVLWQVALPLSGPPLVTLFVVNALYIWNDLLIALIFLPRDETRTLMAGISIFQGRYNSQIPLTMAGMLVASLPMLLLYIIFQRYFIRGLVAGALKGWFVGNRCQIRQGQVNGHRAVYLESDQLAVTVLPEKGADIYALVHQSSGIDFLWKNPIGLAPPNAPPQEGSGDAEFLWNYEGAWQELFPSAGNATVYRGRTVPFHGEVALLPWHYATVLNTPDEIAVRFTVETRQTPFRLERIMRLRRGETSLHLEETVTNLGDTEAHFVWGHHCVLGEPFIQAGCKLLTPAQVVITPQVLYEDTARYAPGQRSRWPQATLRDGRQVDLSDIPGRESHSHDDVYLTDLQAGWVAVYNPHKNLSFSLDWDAQVFKWIINWQIYGGADALPFKGLAYGIGIEPWVSDKPLGEAATAGEAIALPAGATFHTSLQARVSVGMFESSD